jgi:hypothetical protein
VRNTRLPVRRIAAPAGALGLRPCARTAPSPGARLYEYFWSDAARRVQTVLGLIWLLDGGLQFQSFLYSRGFLQMIVSGARGQPPWLHDSIIWAARFAYGDLTVWNTLSALTQVAIGLGILYRPLSKLALGGSLAWALVVWWVGEAFGMLFMNMAQPLTGAPGAVFMYGLIALLAWPTDRPAGVFGIRGAKTMWCTLWLVMAWLWLQAPSADPDATKLALTTFATGIHPLDTLQSTLATAAGGHGLVIALVLAALSATIGIAVAADWHARGFLIASIILNLLYWLLPQGLGGIFAGGATDPNSGPVFVLLACGLLPLFPRRPRRLKEAS